MLLAENSNQVFLPWGATNSKFSPCISNLAPLSRPMLYPMCWSHSLSKEEYIPDKIVSGHRLVRIQLIVSSDILEDKVEHKFSMWAVEMVEMKRSFWVDMFYMQTSSTC